MAEQIRKDVAVFIDFENVYVSVRDKLDANPNFEIIMDRCNELGRVILARAYADWYRYPRITSALYANNIEPMYVPTYYYDKDAGRTGRPIKNSVDMNLCIDAMRTLFTVPNISTFVLVTGDRDFIPLVNSIRQQGKDVIIIGVGGAASSHLAQSADEFIFYEQLIGKSLPTVVATPSGRRVSDIDDFERPIERPPERITPRDRATARATANATARAAKPAEQPVAFNEDAAFELLVKAVLEARNRNMMTAFGSLKVLMKEMSGGEFREQQIKDGNGRPLERFKDFIHEAARRGKILISSDGVVNEVFLPGEDPRKLSQFTLASDASGERSSEEPLAPPIDVAADERGDVNDKSRRRRRRGERPERPERNNRNGRNERNISASDADQIVLPPAVAPVSTITVVPNDFVAPTPKAEVVAPSQNDVAPVPVPVVANSVTPVDDADDVAPAQPFSPEERQFVQAIVGASERPLSFQQIHDLLRNTRNRGADGVSRTNEELRSLIKLSINSGELHRIGRGNRVSYRLAVVTPVSDPENVVAPVSEPANAVAPVTMIPTPADMVDDGLTLATAPSKAPRRTKRQDAPVATLPTPAPVSTRAPVAAKKTNVPTPVPVSAPAPVESKKPNQRRTTKATPAPVAKTPEFTPPVAPASTPEPTRATPRRRKKTTE